jgi:transposase
VIDAAAAASVAALGGDASPVAAEGATSVLALLDERRANLVAGRTRLVNQLHALLRDLVPGGAATKLSVTSASNVLRGLRPAGLLETARKALARDLVAELRDADRRIKAVTAQIASAVNATGTTLTDIDGVGPVLAGRFLARTRDPGRFPSRAAFACYAGVAPVEVSSAGHGRHRLPRGGDRQLNLALHLVAVTQVRMRGSAGRVYNDEKIGERKSHSPPTCQTRPCRSGGLVIDEGGGGERR